MKSTIAPVTSSLLLLIASGHSGLEIKILNYCPLYSFVLKYSKAQLLLDDPCT